MRPWSLAPQPVASLRPWGQGRRGVRRTEGVQAVARDLGAIGVKLEVHSNPRAKSLRQTDVPAQDRQAEPAGAAPLPDQLVRATLAALLRVLRESPDLAEQFSAILGNREAALHGPLLVTKAEYAARLSYSIRKLDQLVDAGLPTVGAGRSLRIPVAVADRWVLARLRPGVAGDDLELTAIASVKRRARRSAL